MAEAVVEIVLENLSSFIQNELGLFLGFHQDLRRLSSTLTAIKATLDDAEEKQFSNRAIKDWLQKLKDAAYVLDDILHECATEALELEYKGFKSGASDKVQSSWLSSFRPKHVVFRYKIAKKIKSIRDRLDEIAEEKSKFHLTEMVLERRTRMIGWRQTTSIMTQPQIYGREEDSDKVVDFLVGDASDYEVLSIYPIVGLGGLGKTTLAQLIFNHGRVVNHFELRIWVCVSEDFSLKRMTKAIIEAESGHACDNLDLEPMQRKLQDQLRSKRYLLVLDDVWDHEQENWQRLKSVLGCGAKGASILVTTRLPKVAAIMGTVPPHELSMLSDNDCWELFKQRAFGPNEAERTELVIIGKEIVKKSGGVPLAAIALGSLLRFKREEKEWLHIKESKLWSLQDGNIVMPALRLSYLNLPAKLRQCFAFCALFPKDEIISKQFLIQLWIANGFISSTKLLEAEDIGDEVWNELYWRSFFQDIETDEFGKIKSFKIHDLVHDLAQSIAEEVCCITNDSDVTSLSERSHHLSNYWKVNSIQLHQVKSLRTCIIPNGYNTDQFSPRVLKCYSLRALCFTYGKKLSSSIGRLKHLRYLNLSWSGFKTLPDSICELWNLQILNLNYCQYLQNLPNNLICLKALQHLSLTHCHSLLSLPPYIGKLTSLMTLSMYFVGKEKGFFLTELGQLNLKGELRIKHLERVKSVMDVKEANMSSKHLNFLLLSWGRNEQSELQENVEQILEVFQPHTEQLQYFSVQGYAGAYFPQWMSDLSLKNLEYLELGNCNGCLHLPQLGKLPSLKNLKLSEMSQVEYLYEESYDGEVFTALKFLLLQKLSNLIRLSREESENMFPRLSKIQITECPKLLSLPNLPSLNELRIAGKCNQELLTSIGKLTSLQSLYLRENEELTCFPEGMLQNLTSLKILDICELSKLEVLPTENINLKDIQELYINGVDSLKSLPNEILQQGLHSLKILNIARSCEFNLSAGFQYLTSLKELTIQNCKKVEALHEALQHMTALQSLILCDLPNLRSLPDWLGNFGLLSKLFISICPKLTSLPTSIQHLSNMELLEICGCPELGKRCKKEIGEDWPKIAHIQSIRIHNCRMYYIRSGGIYRPEGEYLWADRYESWE